MKLLPALLVFAPFALWGCGPSTTESQTGSSRGAARLKVVATTGMVGDLAKNVMGERAHVEVLMGPGVDPHLYKASPGDISKIQSAEVILYNGLHLEGKMADVFEKVGQKKPVIAVAELLDRARLMDSGQGTPDPHVWFDVSLWGEIAEPLAQRLGSEDAEHAESYADNARRYAQELRKLHEEVLGALAAIPEDRRVLVTAHDAFQYFGRAYGVEVLGIQGISTDSEAGLREINNLVSLLVNRNVPAVFVESSVSEKNVQALVEGARRRGHAVRIGGSLFSDAMGPASTAEGTYIGMVRHNVRTIVEALKP